MTQKSLMEIFEENELNIASLYELYEQSILEKSTFWHKLSSEEIAHAKSIRTQKAAFEAIVENKFSRDAINYVITFVRNELKKAQKNNVSHENALNIALRIEQSMLEKKCFDLFIPTTNAAKKIFLKLNKETERHVEILLAEMKKNKFAFEDMKR